MSDQHPQPACPGHYDPHMTCKRIIVELLGQYLEKATDPDLTQAIELHIRNCPPCVKFVEDYDVTRQAVRTLRYEDIPPELSERLSAMVRRESGRAQGE